MLIINANVRIVLPRRLEMAACVLAGHGLKFTGRMVRGMFEVTPV